MKALDLKGFKKVASDEHTTTLKHVYGHELKVAHKALSSKLRKELDSLPGHKPKKMAEGGIADYESGTSTGQDDEPYTPPAPESAPVPFDAQAMMRDPMTGESPEQSFGQGQAYSERAPGTSEPSAAPSEPQGPPEAPAAAPTPAAAPSAPATNPYAGYAQPAAAPSGGGARAPAAAPPQAPPQFTPQQTAQYLKEQNAAFQQDINSGNIKPETFESLFAKKDTLGKIGTLFGLLVSGAGSGLVGQPNAVLAMIQKEIDNDFEAQKQSKTNQHNLLKLNQEHQMQMAQMHQMEFQNQHLAAQTGVAQAQVGNIASEIEARKHSVALTDAQTREAGLRAQAAAKMQANSMVVSSLVSTLGKLPPGSQEYMQAQQQLAMLSQSIQNENYSIADRAAASTAMSNMMLGTGNVGGTEQAYQTNQQFLRAVGQDKVADHNDRRHISGIPGLENKQANRDITADDNKAILAAQNMERATLDYRKFVQENAGIKNMDWAKSNEGMTKAKELQSAYRIARNFGTPTGGEQEFIAQIIPTDPMQFFADQRTLPKIDAVLHTTRTNLDTHLKSLGFTGLPRKVTK